MIKRQIRKFLSGDITDGQKKIELLEKRIRELEKLTGQQQKRIEALMTDLSHRQSAPLREGELLAEAGSRQIWVIKCPAPDHQRKVNWGDYHFALSLKKNLEKLGILVQIDYRDDWEYEPAADVVLVLRGNRFYRPKRWQSPAGQKTSCRSCVYLMWNISHPDEVSDAEYEMYDAVCVASRRYAEELKKRLHVPVYPLLQCTDTEVFCPAERTEVAQPAEIKYDFVFVGNSREVYRPGIMWAVEEGAEPAIWGDHWKRFLKDRMDLVQEKSVANEQIPDIYHNAGAVLNDHWEDMRRCQFVNNRIFDALACGVPVITDTFPELEELSLGGLLHYHSREEYVQCLERARRENAQLRRAASSGWERIEKEFSFESRARKLVEIVRELG